MVTPELLRHVYGGRRVTVMGLGHFGGGLGAAKFLALHGARVTVTDQKRPDQLQTPLQELRGVPIERYTFGTHRDEDFDAADLVVASPAIRPDHPQLERARSAGIRVTTEIGLFWSHCPAAIIGVTGTVGKSTTTALIEHLLVTNGRRAWLGGNIGGSLLPKLSLIQPDDWVVLELSSFQLMYLDHEGRAPRIAVVTNLTPNHLDWHGSVEEYSRAKQSLLRHQSSRDTAVLPEWDQHLLDWNGPGKTIRVTAAEWLDTLPTDVLLPGPHSRLNMAVAVAAAVAAGVPHAECLATVGRFRGLPHRLEYVGEYQGRKFYDDSKATTPEAAIAALQAFDSPLIVLAGGSSKGVDLRLFARELARRAKAVSLMGATAGELNQLMAAEPSISVNSMRRVAVDFPSAFAWAFEQSSPGDVILLSPGCASYGWFRDYAERGARFRELLEGLPR